VRLVISDQHLGLKAGVEAVVVGSAWQRCWAHFMRNVLARVARSNTRMVIAAIQTILVQPDAAAVRAQFDRSSATLSGQFPDVAQMLELAKEDPLTFGAFPEAHSRKVWSANPLERLHRKIKRRSSGLPCPSPSFDTRKGCGARTAVTVRRDRYGGSTFYDELEPAQDIAWLIAEIEEDPCVFWS
jgi:transposase-like protein